MAGRFRRHTHHGSRLRRKVEWVRSFATSGPVPLDFDPDVPWCGWAIWPTGTPNFDFTPPAVNPPDLTLVRTLWWPYITITSPSALECAYDIGLGLIPWTAQDPTSLDGVFVDNTLGDVGIPDPSVPGTWDWVLQKHYNFTNVGTPDSSITFYPTVDFDVQSRAQRKLPFGTGLLFVMGALRTAVTGSVPAISFGVTMNCAVKLPV